MTTPEATPITTPRPWRMGARQDPDEFWFGHGYVEIEGREGEAIAPFRNDYEALADAALIVEAVNNFDRLRRIETAARAVSELADADDDFEGKFIDWLVPADALAALRAALDEESQP